MEIVCIELERNLLQHGDGVDPVSAVELGKPCAEQRILHPAEDLVSHVFVERHASLEGGALLHHPAAEYCIRAAIGQRLEQLGQLLGGILAVAMKEGDE